MPTGAVFKQPRVLVWFHLTFPNYGVLGSLRKALDTAWHETVACRQLSMCRSIAGMEKHHVWGLESLFL